MARRSKTRSKRHAAQMSAIDLYLSKPTDPEPPRYDALDEEAK